MAVASTVCTESSNTQPLPGVITMNGRPRRKGKPSFRKPRIERSAVHRAISIEVAHSLSQLAKNSFSTHNLATVSPVVEKKRVSFAPMATVFSVPKPTKEENGERWYNTDEYKTFEMDRRNTILAVHWAMENLVGLDPEQFTTVGLENSMSSRHVYERKCKLMRHSCTILKQHYYEKHKNTYAQNFMLPICDTYLRDRSNVQYIRNEQLSSSLHISKSLKALDYALKLQQI